MRRYQLNREQALVTGILSFAQPVLRLREINC